MCNWEPPEQQPAKTVLCAVCKEDTPAYYTTEVGGMPVCDECITRFYRDQASPDQCGAAYIAEGEQRYIEDQCLSADSNELYYNWWLSGLEKADRLRILKNAYQSEKESNGAAYYPDWEKDFCVDSSDWKDFVDKQIEIN